MTARTLFLAGTALVFLAAPAAARDGLTDSQIAHVAYIAGNIDIDTAEQALDRSRNGSIRAFAQQMVRDHRAVNAKALALVKKLNVTPEANPLSASLTTQARATAARLGSLQGDAFDRAYAQNEIAYHRNVNQALEKTLIPAASNAELKALLQTGLTLFREHQAHAEQVAAALK
jgi:putative membrane protein